MLWADEEQASQGPLHVGFKPGNGGEQLGLIQQSGATIRFIDSLSFGAQTNNISRGRLPNGGSSFGNFTITTPGASNGENTGTVDCNGVAGGSAMIDDCGICAGGNTGKIPNANKDCNGDCFGTATLDDCKICSGGNSGHVANSDKDSCGVCFGNGLPADLHRLVFKMR